jgi:DNA-binding transcriptional ArsR family regulator
MHVCACESLSITETHDVATHDRLSLEDATQIAAVLGALSTASRIRILALLRVNPCTVGELTTALAMEQPAVSHQLRVLRNLGLVVGARSGRNVVYRLYDSHIAALVDEALRHLDHLAAGAPDSTVRARPSPPRRPSKETP